jgi:hypothetical protein
MFGQFAWEAAVDDEPLDVEPDVELVGVFVVVVLVAA